MDGMNLYQKAYGDALVINSQETERWNAYRKEHEDVRENLRMYQKQLKVDILIPIGSKAFLPGQLYHTGEVMASHGCGYFSDCSMEQANLLINHRIAVADKMLQNYDNERELYTSKLEVPFTEDAFSGQEIIEEYDEEQEKSWREQHRIRNRQHKQQEAQKRLESQNLASDADILNRLEELELMEELEQEIDSLEIPIDNDEQLRRLMDGEIKLNDKKRLAHNTTEQVCATDRTNSKIQIDFDRDKKEKECIEVITSDDETSSYASDVVSPEFEILLKKTESMDKHEKLHVFKRKLEEVKRRLNRNDITIEEKVDLCDLRYEIEESLDFMNPSWETIEDPSIASKGGKKKKTITFANTEDVKIIDNREAVSTVSELEDNGRTKTLVLKVVHSMTEPALLDVSNPKEMQSPADIYRVFEHCLHSEDTPTVETKSILKNRDMIAAETHRTDANFVRKQSLERYQKAPARDIIGDVIERKTDSCPIQPTIPSNGEKKVSQFKLRRH